MNKRRGKKGLSGIVTALILIVLVLVAAGIVWAVYNSLIKGSAEDVEFNSKCMGIVLDVKSLTCDADSCNALVERGAGSTEVFEGYETSFGDSSTSDDYSGVEGNIAIKASPTSSSWNEGNPATEFRIRAYFLKEDGEKYYCTPVVYKKP